MKNIFLAGMSMVMLLLIMSCSTEQEKNAIPYPNAEWKGVQGKTLADSKPDFIGQPQAPQCAGHTRQGVKRPFAWAALEAGNVVQGRNDIVVPLAILPHHVRHRALVTVQRRDGGWLYVDGETGADAS